ncbi:hypothetical protein ACH5RR_015772 [Cinchona calisaya]|uniref:BED-type domain-containing protein n=1 Tax=Cinchona calisaya TaxID=153742 RepID=A0ABD2ZVB4_9GENT
MQSQKEISSNPTLSTENSSTPVFLDTPFPPSNENEPVQLQNITVEDTNVMGATSGVPKQFNQQNEDGQNLETFQVKKRCKKSEAWNDFKDVVVDGVKKVECIHCKSKLAKNATGTTSSMIRHRQTCVIRKMSLRQAVQQTKINFQPTDAPILPIPPLHFGKFDMEKMRKAAARWVLMHEHPFSILEEEGFNFMMKLGLPDWQKISRNTSKVDCVAVYELEKKKLKNLLKNVNKISLTTDLWKSKNQKIEYMVITGHWIDSSWKLQKRVLSFVHIPPPQRGVEISDAIFKCLKE